MVGQASIPTVAELTHAARPKKGAASKAWREAFKAGYVFTVQDAVAELKISERTIRRHMEAGTLRHTKAGNRILLHGEDTRALRRAIYLENLAKEAEEKAKAKAAAKKKRCKKPRATNDKEATQ